MGRYTRPRADEAWARCRRCRHRVLASRDGLLELIPDGNGGVKARVAAVQGDKADIELLFRPHVCEHGR